MKTSLLLASGIFLALAAALPAKASLINYNVTTTWYEPDTQPVNSVFVGSFTYDSTTHLVTNLQGQLSESMTGSKGYVYGNVPGANDDATWLSLTTQLANGDASHQYEWHDATLGGTFATVFLQNTSLTFATSYNGVSGDGWSPQGGIAVKWKYPQPNNSPNASALIFVPDNLGLGASLAWDESTDTGSLGLAHTAYADNTPGGYMGTIGMTGTSLYVYGHKGTMSGVPQSEVITAAPEPASLIMIAATVPLLMRRRRHAGPAHAGRAGQADARRSNMV